MRAGGAQGARPAVDVPQQGGTHAPRFLLAPLPPRPKSTHPVPLVHPRHPPPSMQPPPGAVWALGAALARAPPLLAAAAPLLASSGAFSLRAALGGAPAVPCGAPAARGLAAAAAAAVAAHGPLPLVQPRRQSAPIPLQQRPQRGCHTTHKLAEAAPSTAPPEPWAPRPDPHRLLHPAPSGVRTSAVASLAKRLGADVTCVAAAVQRLSPDRQHRLLLHADAVACHLLVRAGVLLALEGRPALRAGERPSRNRHRTRRSAARPTRRCADGCC